MCEHLSNQSKDCTSVTLIERQHHKHSRDERNQDKKDDSKCSVESENVGMIINKDK